MAPGWGRMMTGGPPRACTWYRRMPPMSPSRKPLAAADAKPGGRYHHGDLRAALLAAAELILEEEGVEGLSLRACARRVGVSHAAPAHHFGDLTGLRTACAARNFAALEARLVLSDQQVGDDPAARLRASARAYIDFARARPASYRLMFRCQLIDPEDAQLKAANEACYARLLDFIGLLSPGAGLKTLQTRAVLVWSLFHGYTSLLLDGVFASVCPPGMEPGREGELAERLVDDVLRLFP